MKTLYFISALLLVTFQLSVAQLLDCATLVSEKQLQLESTSIDSVNEIRKLHRTFHLTFHVVKNEEDLPGIDINQIEPAINEMNNAFQPIGVTFKNAQLNYVDNHHYNTIYYNDTDNELVDISHAANTVNIYLVEKLYDVEGRITCSYTFMPADGKDLIFIQKTCFDAVRLIHLIGHVFNLYHTHEETFGNEPVDGSNCNNTGDLCCDTEASPDLTTLTNDDCEYEGNLKDENGEYYYPSARNFMSFAPSPCRCYFTEEQYIRMMNAMLGLKDYLW